MFKRSAKPQNRQDQPTPKRLPRSLPAPDAQSLQNGALTHLARYATTEAGLAQVLNRRIDRWARQSDAEPEVIEASTAAARAAIPEIVHRLASSGAISDTDFAKSRAKSLARAGRSRRAIGAHLASKGVPGLLAADATPENTDQELAAALVHARKRRMGPWRRVPPSPELQRRELASFARAGYAHSTASRALKMPVDAAEQLIIDFRAAL